ncbi:MAG: alpha-glucosidase/alpha-galactosidase [bacterium (Candidatus Ratteibacteria) CG_4_10_14_3_um_filter_41_18]|uniref:Alpha-glucosidase/alpha-galactosidase n=3 Tax=Candidatus Ratteibacteria TaxID=2979319 RepID=A0A2M7E7C4_9BACT|nr:MAG: alpha-glucosidase/alpha-galactosidase [bacterium (Candidatus Ratteibacteria) CG01_land_8_20_14_3_00_40_19]PIX77532.1 MAG: alpha-glucosidase/alpha-galactosidase [bacterium (Candidatus Ratteibacteria) CG_4_10_14_3_um_filter_41_18]PJA61617.1 MAG: alpha-glucosidase/alpha-galactosidase [bacterium (Candidatus Ratteibacteria) CG_4_9_14_3_um_filter_41_21]HCG76397.1 alpha-glucosidase/alpha-galactosidase [bacterium]
MARIVFIGAGSFGFTRGLVKDLLTFPLLKDANIVLMDVNKERLEFSQKALQRIINEGKYPAHLEATMDRKKALKGADAVVCTILAGSIDVWRYDIEIPMKYGVDINIGDSRGVSGIFRALRTIPVMLSICRDMERLCPDAILLNYTNPMAMLCRAMQRKSQIKVSGLCHSVQGTAAMLARWIGAKMSQITYLCAGINHQSWYLEYKKDGKDAYPLIRKALQKKEIYNEEQVRNEMFFAFDYYLTESSGHNSEYVWWFRKRPELIEKYCTYGTGWNPGKHRYILDEYLKQEDTWKDEIKKWLNDKKPLNLKRGKEYASSIINSYLGGKPFIFNGNVPNNRLIPNLPQNACVEIPVLADKRGFNPMYVGPLPPQCAALNNLSIAVEEMAVEGALTGDAHLIYQAICYDPLPASVLSLAEIKKMVQELFKVNKDSLPTFKRIKI